MEEKIKIALICHFSNPIVRSHLPLDNRKLYNSVRKCVGLEARNKTYIDIASWDTNFINNMKDRDDVELIVISAHSGLKRKVVSFEEEGVKYHFVRCDEATFLKHIIKSPSLWHKLNPMRPIVRRIAHHENPDIVALMGAENAYYSGTVLGLEKEYPIIFKAQTIYNNPNRGKYSVVDAKNAYVERLIFEAVNYVSVTTKMHYSMYREFNKESYNFRWQLGTSFPKVKAIDSKEFDFVNFANSMIPSKGFCDVLEAMAIVAKKHPQAKLNIIGTPNGENEKLYQDIIARNDLSKNVTITPFFEKQEDLFQHLQKSRFAVLPYKLDYVASTTYQAMHYEMPVVVYRTEGTPTLNKEKECVLIAEMDNVEQLAKQMLYLYENPQEAGRLRQNAKELVDSQNDGKRIGDEIVTNFKAIINHYKNKQAIPAGLLINPLEQ